MTVHRPAAAPRCPSCDGMCVRHGTYRANVHDVPDANGSVVRQATVQRWRCRVCKETFTEGLAQDSLDVRHKVTLALIDWIARESLHRPFAQVAHQAGVNEKTVRSLFRACVERWEASFQPAWPARLGIVPCQLIRSRWCLLNGDDPTAPTVVDVLPDVAWATLEKTLEKHPRLERATVMPTFPHRAALAERWPNVLIDTFSERPAVVGELERVRRSHSFEAIRAAALFGHLNLVPAKIVNHEGRTSKNKGDCSARSRASVVGEPAVVEGLEKHRQGKRLMVQ